MTTKEKKYITGSQSVDEVFDNLQFHLQISKQDDHEFYDLVNAYFRGRNALAIAIKEYEVCCLLNTIFTFKCVACNCASVTTVQVPIQ